MCWRAGLTIGVCTKSDKAYASLLMQVGFHLKPVNFYDGNPGINLAPGPNKTSREHQDGSGCESCAAQSKL